MLSFFRNRKLYNEVMDKIKNGNLGLDSLRKLLPTLPIQVVYRIGKTAIYKDYDGYNYNKINQSMCYFENLDRFGKEFYIEQHYYNLIK